MGKLAEFKAIIINVFVLKNKITSIIEFGCGDGSQLKYSEYPNYTGYDISPKAISLCKEAFINDSAKTFKLLTDYNNETAELVLSLDVIFHLVEDTVFTSYMNKLFFAAQKFIVIYSSNIEENLERQASHVKHRQFSDLLLKMKPNWKLLKHIPNNYPFKGDTRTGSFSDFFIYEKV